jgi:chaperonin GroES
MEGHCVWACGAYNRSRPAHGSVFAVVYAENLHNRITKTTMAKAKKKVVRKPVKKSVQKKSKPAAPAVSAKEPRFALTPIGDRVILEEVRDSVDRTSSGIYLPESAQDKETKKGRVVAVGAGRYEDGDLIPMTLKVGDVVIYAWGDKVKVNAVEYTIVREGDITAIVNE